MKHFSYIRFSVLSAALGLAACANTLPSTPKDTLVKDVPSESLQSAVLEGSARLFDEHDALRLKVERQPTVAEPVVPVVVDPLAAKKISMSIRDAHIGQLLWILANEFNLSLSVQPSVLAMTQVASLHLQKVTGREALDQILAAFDVDAKLSDGKVLMVTDQQEKVFYLEALSGKSYIDVASGGDVFGAGAAKGTNSLRDAMTVTSELGDRTDSYEQLIKVVDAILADREKADSGSGREKPRYGLDRAGGTLYVKASPSKVAAVKALLDRGNEFRQRQVQIEAQLVDVQLSEGSQLGIDWTILGNRVAARLGADVANVASGSSAVLPGLRLVDRALTIPAQDVGVAGGGGALLTGQAFSAAINALRTFGAVKVLSNPTIRVRNGIPAMLTVGTNTRYVQKISSSSSQNGVSTTASMDVQTDSVFSGIVVGVSAVVKSNGRIELFVRPSQSQVQNKSLALVDVGSGNKVTLPIIDTKSITTTLNMQSGETVIIGGLIDQQIGGGGSGVPGLSEISGLGKLFGSTNDSQAGREMVVILRVRVI